jgi:hypothetical protein
VFEISSNVLFSIEILIRSIAEINEPKNLRAFTFVFDILAVLPFYIGFFNPGDSSFLRYLRGCKLARIGKLGRLVTFKFIFY